MTFRGRVEYLGTGYGERFIEIACEPLPEPLRAVRCEEWRAEFPAILDDDENLWPLRVVTLLVYSADQIRGTWSARDRRDQIGLTVWLLGTGGALCFRAVTSLALMVLFFVGNGLVTVVGFVVAYIVGMVLGGAFGASMLDGPWGGDDLRKVVGGVALKAGCLLLVGLAGWFAGVLGGLFHGATHGAIVLGVSSGTVLGIGGGLTIGNDTDAASITAALVTLVAAAVRGIARGVRSNDDRTCDVGNLLTGFLVVAYVHGAIVGATAQFGIADFGISGFLAGVVVGAVMMLACLLTQLRGPHTVRFLGIGAGALTEGPRHLARFR